LLAAGLLATVVVFLLAQVVYLGVAQKKRPRVVGLASATSVVWSGAEVHSARLAPSDLPKERDFYVSPDGRPNGTGKRNAPWDLQTALSHPRRVRPGDTIWLLGGTYRGTFTSQLTGTAEEPIVVRQYPGERAVIDGNWTTSLSAPITSTQTSFTVDDSSFIRTGGSVNIEGEEIQINGKVVGTSIEKCVRGTRRTAPAAHRAGATVKNSDAALLINGAHTWYWSFEIHNSNPDRANAGRGSHPPERRGTGVMVYAPGSKLINLVIHDTGQGVGFFSQATDAEVYGCLIYNNGWRGPDRGHGHGIYTQNATGTKQVRDNILFGNLGGFAIHCYGTDQARLRGYEFTGNTVFENDWLVGGGTPASRITITENYLYGTGLKLGYSNRFNEDAMVRGNYVYSELPLNAQWWSKLTVTDNYFFGRQSSQGGNVTLRMREEGTTTDHTFERNRYVNGRSGMDRTFGIFESGGTKQAYFFDEWQELGYDVQGSFASGEGSEGGVRPTGINVFVRRNLYERRRLAVTIFNWDLAGEILVDLSNAGF
jgi:hypothetical protein